MEEILASIRRIIADDEARPAAGAEVAPASNGPVSNSPASNSPAPRSEAPQAVKSSAPQPPAPPKPAPPRPAVVADGDGNSQDDIDALLAGLDASTTDADVRSAAPVGDVLELTDDMAVSDSTRQAAFQKIEPADDLEFAEMSSADEPPPMASRPMMMDYDADMAPQSPPSPVASQMLSQSTVSAVESAFNTLANTVLSNNARTLEDLVREMLRPMLKSWLDDNLPGLVERIVRSEIERVSRGR